MLTRRQNHFLRHGALKNERSSWMDHYRELSDFLLPRTGRFMSSDRNKGGKRHNNIYDSTGTWALGVLAAGLMAGMTSPARPWFRLATSDPGLMEFGPVKYWLHDVTTLMRDIFARSNSYRSLHMIYEEIGCYGTAASLILPDFQDVVRHYPLTTGEYCIAADKRGEIDTLYREWDMTVAQLVAEFGIENVSRSVKDLYKESRGLDNWITVVHAIQPRTESDREYGKRDAKNMPFSSCYYEKNGDDNDKPLRESGFKRFPAVVPRWHVSGGDIYGNSPGMVALGDVKQLQHAQVRKAEGIDYKTRPPIQVPTSMKTHQVKTLPGGVSFVDRTGPENGIRTAFAVDIDLQHQLMDIEDGRKMIGRGFYADLFLMLANDNRSGITATEVAEKHEEKLLMLGPVLERLHNEMLNQIIDTTFDEIMSAGILPPPPQEMHGTELKVEFVSVLAQAQKAIGLQAIDKLLGVISVIAPIKPEILDKIDSDQLVDEVSDILGVSPHLIVTDDQVALVRADRAKAQQAAQQQAQLPATAGAAKDLASADTGGQNALTDVMKMFQGYSTPATTGAA